MDRPELVQAPPTKGSAEGGNTTVQLGDGVTPRLLALWPRGNVVGGGKRISDDAVAAGLRDPLCELLDRGERPAARPAVWVERLV
jgi:hypothetical protein